LSIYRLLYAAFSVLTSLFCYAYSLQKKKEEAEEETIKRVSVWTVSRVGKDGVIDNEEVQKIADKCVSQI